ncbi:MAG TPA: hypothetical protein VGO09_06075 [Flavisolibacter sp.]|nr:hypothetical protein [Flavisolibacter sp.]
MIKINLSILFFFFLIVSLMSCKKQTQDQNVSNPGLSRTIRFRLYTDKDFSSDNNSIQFTLSIKTAATNQVIWDSTLALSRIKDIPGVSNKLVFEKTISGNDSVLKTGFYYTIPGVGNSWFLDTCGKTSALKIIDFNFQ